MKERCLLRDEHGSVLVIGLVMLMLLTLLGISVTTTSTIEIRIAGNERDHKQSLYLAEAAAMEAAQRLQNLQNPKDNPPPDNWLNPDEGGITDDNIRDENYWEGGAPYPPKASLSNALFLASFEGFAPGASLDMAKASKVYAYSIYGRCNENNAVAIVEIGYTMAF